MDPLSSAVTAIRSRPRVIFPSQDFDASDTQTTWSIAGEDIMVVGRFLICRGHYMDLERCELKLRMLRAFCARASGHSLRDLLGVVYDIPDLDACSPRAQKSARLRLHKLISKSRQQLRSFFGSEYEWLSYDRERKVWTLCRRSQGGQSSLLC